MKENLKQRKIYRICTDAVNKVWDKIYFLTNATSVDAEDGDNLETKVGAIKGITASTSVTETGYAADATAVAALNESLGGLSFTIVDGEPYVKVGADTPRPFKSVDSAELVYELIDINGNVDYTINEDGYYLIYVNFNYSLGRSYVNIADTIYVPHGESTSPPKSFSKIIKLSEGQKVIVTAVDTYDWSNPSAIAIHKLQ